MIDRATAVAAVENYCRAQCEKDKQGWAALFTEDVFHEDPVGLPGTRGLSHVAGAFWDRIVHNDVHIWLTDDVILCGREAIAVMACDIGPAGNRRRLSPVVDHFIFADDGRMLSVRGFYNFG